MLPVGWAAGTPPGWVVWENANPPARRTTAQHDKTHLLEVMIVSFQPGFPI
jgi:hypothetical protein